MLICILLYGSDPTGDMERLFLFRLKSESLTANCAEKFLDKPDDRSPAISVETNKNIYYFTTT